jgi:hypothetical protein
MARSRKKFHIIGQFVPFRVDMLESDAWAALSINGRRVLDRLCIEHAHHGGTENGNLIVTYDDFVQFGIRRQSVKPAIDETVHLGLVEITELGRGGNA